MALRDGSFFCNLPDIPPFTAAARTAGTRDASLGIRCSLYTSSLSFDSNAVPTPLYSPSRAIAPDGVQERFAYVESDWPYMAVELALEGVDNRLLPFTWDYGAPLYARLSVDGCADAVVERSVYFHRTHSQSDCLLLP